MAGGLSRGEVNPLSVYASVTPASLALVVYILTALLDLEECRRIHCWLRAMTDVQSDLTEWQADLEVSKARWNPSACACVHPRNSLVYVLSYPVL